VCCCTTLRKLEVRVLARVHTEENANENVTCKMHLFLNTQTHTPNFNAHSLLTYLLFQFPVPVNYSLQIADDFIYTSVVNWLTVVFFLYVWHTIDQTRPSLTKQLTSGVTPSRMSKGGHFEQLLIRMTRHVSFFVKCDTICQICWMLFLFENSNF